MEYKLLTILGHTAGGKTSLAAQLAYLLKGEIISADSRQVYRGLNIGTGKDYDDYSVKGQQIPYHLIDIIDVGVEYNVFQYQQDVEVAYQTIQQREKFPILCGGSGLYVEAIVKGYRLRDVPKNEGLRKELEQKTLFELAEELKQYKELHNSTDIETKKRAIRAIEIERYYAEHPMPKENDFFIPPHECLLVGVNYEREQRRNRITERLEQRLQHGMIEESQALLASGVTHEQLEWYGLE